MFVYVVVIGVRGSNYLLVENVNGPYNHECLLCLWLSLSPGNDVLIRSGVFCVPP